MAYRRRPIILAGALFAAVIAAAVLPGGCARTPRTFRVGVLVGADTMAVIVDDFKARMTELGYVEGTNITYDVQASKADPAQERRIADKFVSDKVDLVFAFPGQPALAVKAAAQGTRIPIVFANALIEGNALVDSVRAPGATITGVRIPNPDLTLKSFESLREVNPRIKRIMAIYSSDYPTNPVVLEAVRSEASAANVTLQEVRVPKVQDTQAVLRGVEKSGNADMDAILLFPDLIPRSSEAADAIIAFADAHRVPVVGGPPTLIRAGALLTEGTDQREQGRLAASLADKIFKGTPAGTIPVMTTEPHLYINYRKAQELGLSIPQGLLKQATEIVH